MFLHIFQEHKVLILILILKHQPNKFNMIKIFCYVRIRL